MTRASRAIFALPLCFTLLMGWFTWSAYRAAPPLASENLRGAALSLAAAIERLADADPGFAHLDRFTSPDIAYYALIDGGGTIRFHTNPRLVGQAFAGGMERVSSREGSERRLRLGTGEEVYLLRTPIHPRHQEYLLELALHTYRYDNVIRRARTGVSVVLVLTAAVWALTLALGLLLRRQERQARDLQRREELARLGEMGAVLAHEIRNPLAGIKGFAQMVQGADRMELARTYADRIVSQSQRLESLVDDLLAFARIDRDDPQQTDLSALLENCALLLAPEAREQQVALELESDSKVTACVMAHRLTQLVLNLMKNALQAMPEGGVLTLRLWKENGSACLSVSDTGCGIEPEHLPHIFEPFWTSKATGTGLGLALCSKVAQEHGGTLSVVSRVASGTVCTVTLPGP